MRIEKPRQINPDHVAMVLRMLDNAYDMGAAGTKEMHDDIKPVIATGIVNDLRPNGPAMLADTPVDTRILAALVEHPVK